MDYERVLAEAAVVAGGRACSKFPLEGADRQMPWLPVFAIALSAQNA